MDYSLIPTGQNECCGCSACQFICSKDAIYFEKDKEGFLYPQIDKNKCINCGLCVKNCPFFNAKKREASITSAYFAKHKNTNIRMHSRSGAVFVAISDWILQNNGVIYGCILDSNMQVKHCRADNKVDRDKMCKSKYVQSAIGDIINQIAEDLSNNRYVLFTGTGCQVDGVLSALTFKRINTQNLYCVDIVCHGCASPMVFNDYINWIQNKHNGKVDSFDFRDKNVCGWDGHIESYIINGKKYKSTIFREIFHTDLCLRPTCYNCKYSIVERRSDLTIADAWGIKQSAPGFNDNRGASMILIQNEKGYTLIKAIKNSCDVLEVPVKCVLQPNLIRPSAPKGDRQAFWSCYSENGINGIIKKYGKLSIKKKVQSTIKYKLRKIIQSKKYFLP